MSKKILLAGNGPYENHGCEAIVRGTINILNEQYDEIKYLVSTYYNNSQQYINQKQNEREANIEHIQHINADRYSKEWILSNLYGLINEDRKRNYRFRNLNQYINEVSAVLSVGGDNYSLDYGVPKKFTDLDDYVLSKGKPIIIWGASIGPFTKNIEYEKYMSEHLKRVTAIFARESETIKYLDSIGVRDNVYRVCDPAFMLEVSQNMSSNLEIEKGAIGINISPLMIRYMLNFNRDEFIKLSAKVINKILIKTGRTIYLIPHVVIDGDSDYEIMSKIYNNIDEKLKSRVTLISDKLSASEYKYIISKMEVFFGARTHSTIASLSTLVPTLSFVYSIKSIGINKDLFGGEEYCIYPEQFNENELTEKIEYLLDNKDKIQFDLKLRVDECKRMALKAGNHLNSILNYQ